MNKTDTKSAVQAFIMCASDSLNTTVGGLVGFVGSGLSHRVILITSLLTALSGALSMSSGEWLSTDAIKGRGNPWSAAATGFISFAVCSLTPISPYFFMQDAFVPSAILGAIVLFFVGAIGARYTGKSALFAGSRQILIGLAFAAITYLAGGILGIQIGG